MAYTEEFLGLAIVPQSAASVTPVSLTATSTYARFVVQASAQVTRISAYITTAVVADTGAPVITVYRRPTYGSDTGIVTLGTLTIPHGSVVGAVVYKNLESVRLHVGDELVYKVTTAGTSATSAAGNAFVGAVIAQQPEDPRNETLAVASV